MATWARTVRPFTRAQATQLQASCRRGVMGRTLRSADRWLLRLTKLGHYMDPDMRVALRLDSILHVLLLAAGAEWLAHAFGLAADYRR
eukprot:8508654-Alexandrium_andersonii.AAC.1